MTHVLADGLTPVPAGKIATIVTSLQMFEAAPARPMRALTDGLGIARRAYPTLDWYRDLYRRIGEDLLWFSRLQLADAELQDILGSPDVEIYTLTHNGQDEGLLELDFREPGHCELVFFGVTPGLVGAGAGRLMMNAAIKLAFARPISRFWVHTCTLDHPNALDFYRRSGFVPFQRLIEIADDPRLTGGCKADAAPQVPML